MHAVRDGWGRRRAPIAEVGATTLEYGVMVFVLLVAIAVTLATVLND